MCRHVEPLLKELEAATQEVARNPRDPAKKNKAEELLKQVNQDLDKLADILGATDHDVPLAAKDSAAVRKQAQKVRFFIYLSTQQKYLLVF